MQYRTPHKGDRASASIARLHVAEHMRLDGERVALAGAGPGARAGLARTVLGKIVSVDVNADDSVSYTWCPVSITAGVDEAASYVDMGFGGADTTLPKLVEANDAGDGTGAYAVDDIVVVHVLDGENGLAYVLAGRPGGSGVSESSTFVAHYAGEEETTAAFYSLGGCLNSIIEIGLDVRQCYDNGGLPSLHPACQETRTSGGIIGALGNVLATWSGDDDEWVDLAYCARGGVADATGTLLGRGTQAIAGFYIQCRVTTAGVLEFRVDNTNEAGPIFNGCVIVGLIRKTTHLQAPGTAEAPIIEFGSGGSYGEGSGGIHELLEKGENEEGIAEMATQGTVWGDGIWKPYEP